MGVFSRFKDIVNANINSLLDKAEDPEKMLRLMMQEMEDTLIELKSNCAARMAGRIRLTRQIEEQKALVSRWQSRAKMAIDRDRDDLAREALLEKKKEKERLSQLEKDAVAYDEIIKENRDEIDQLDAKLEQARDKLRLLQEREKAAREQGRMNAHLKGNEEFHFSSMEERIDRMTAENELGKKSSIDDIFTSLEEKEEIERELEELKKNRK